MTSQQALAAAIIKQAITDSKTHRSNSSTWTQSIQKDALDFLNTNRLENFITEWGIPIDAEALRREIKRGMNNGHADAIKN